MIKQYIYNLFLLLSQTISVLLGGHPDKSMSQRTAIAYISHKDTNTLKSKWFKIQLNLIDSLFYNKLWRIEKNHCLNSIDGEGNAREIWDWSK